MVTLEEVFARRIVEDPLFALEWDLAVRLLEADDVASLLRQALAFLDAGTDTELRRSRSTRKGIRALLRERDALVMRRAAEADALTKPQPSADDMATA